MSVFQAEELVRASLVSGMAPFIRVRENAETMITRALDTGASGVQIPQINSGEDAKRAVEASKFYPLGCRGVCRFTRNAQYSHIPSSEYFDMANKNTLVILQIEGQGGVENIDAILDTKGYDVLFIGPYDLSQSLGLTGQVNHPKVLEQIEKITKKARDKGIVVCSFSDNPQSLKRQRDMGIQYLSYRIDTGIIYEAAKFFFEEIKNV
jgi:4-hydroxy-2-oxoheptanedioate aldolase